MDVLALPEFSRRMTSAIMTDADRRDIEALLDALSTDHASPSMQEAHLEIPGTDVSLWVTHPLRLSGIAYRTIWRYEQRDGTRAIVCFTFARE